jgi:hypothetical protein
VITGGEVATFGQFVDEISKRARAAAGSVDGRVQVALAAMNETGIHGLLVASPENISNAIINMVEGRLHTSGGFFNPSLLTHPSLAVSTNLSAFGHKSISFINQGGIAKDLYQDSNDDPNKGKFIKRMVKVKGQKAKGGVTEASRMEEVPFWHFIRVSRVETDLAISDWLNVVANHRILQLEANDGKLLGNVDTHPMPAGGQILTALRLVGRDGRKRKVAGRGEYVAPVAIGEASGSGIGISRFSM